VAELEVLILERLAIDALTASALLSEIQKRSDCDSETHRAGEKQKLSRTSPRVKSPP
jgi:hypothetical protein